MAGCSTKLITYISGAVVFLNVILAIYSMAFSASGVPTGGCEGPNGEGLKTGMDGNGVALVKWVIRNASLSFLAGAIISIGAGGVGGWGGWVSQREVLCCTAALAGFGGTVLVCAALWSQAHASYITANGGMGCLSGPPFAAPCGGEAETKVCENKDVCCFVSPGELGDAVCKVICQKYPNYLAGLGRAFTWATILGWLATIPTCTISCFSCGASCCCPSSFIEFAAQQALVGEALLVAGQQGPQQGPTPGLAKSEEQPGVVEMADMRNNEAGQPEGAASVPPMFEQ